MDKIASFTVNHLLLGPGAYVSRIDEWHDVKVTTFDIRMTAPNREPVMDASTMHAIERLGATFLRNDFQWRDRRIYFGPMGRGDGFYLIAFGKHTPDEIVPVLRAMFGPIADYDGDIPGTKPEECGNHSDSDLPSAKERARKFCAVLDTIDDAHMTYPTFVF